MFPRHDRLRELEARRDRVDAELQRHLSRASIKTGQGTITEAIREHPAAAAGIAFAAGAALGGLFTMGKVARIVQFFAFPVLQRAVMNAVMPPGTMGMPPESGTANAAEATPSVPPPEIEPHEVP